MDPVAGGITLFDAVCKAVKAAKKLYAAPHELKELQVEIDTFARVFSSVASTIHEIGESNAAIWTAVEATQRCLLEIQRLIEYDLLEEVPAGQRAKRTAWLRKAGRAQELQRKLGDCRADVIMALDCEAFVTMHKSGMALQNLEDMVRQKSDDIQRVLHEYGLEQRRATGLLMEQFHLYERRWTSMGRLLESQKRANDQMTNMLEGNRRQFLSVQTQHPKLLKAGDHSGYSALSSSTSWHEEDDATISSSMQFSREHGIAAMKDWLRKCGIKHHASFGRQTKGSNGLPSRVLFVGNGLEDIRLHITEAGESEAYATLSYCCGSAPAVPTTRGSLPSRTLNIPRDDLPLVFQDAIEATLALGLRYLWIDALCIVRDSAGDWEQECSRMDRIYGNSYCTIAAASATDPTTSFLRGDTDKYIDGPSVQTGSLSVPTKKDPWWSRAWAFQERLLSPRLLVFEKNQVTYRILPDARDPAEDPNAWGQVVQKYTGLKLGSHSDKLVALSGIARRFSEATQDTYLAGLWRADLIQSLHWSPGPAARAQDTYTAPSWSWASWNGQVEMPDVANVLASAQLLDYSLEHLGVNEFGGLRSGSITIRAWSVEALVEDVEILEAVGDEQNQCVLHLRQGQLRTVTEADAPGEVEVGTALLCVLLSSSSDGSVHALALRPASETTWRRVAVMELLRRRGEHRWFHDAIERELVLV